MWSLSNSSSKRFEVFFFIALRICPPQNANQPMDRYPNINGFDHQGLRGAKLLISSSQLDFIAAKRRAVVTARHCGEQMV